MGISSTDTLEFFPKLDNDLSIEAPLKKKYTLRVERINLYGYSDIARITTIWQEIAEEKGSLAPTSSERARFYSCKSISQSIYYSASYPDYGKEIYACKDEKGTVQALMVLSVRTNNVYVDYLVTSPNNIRSSVNDCEPDKVEGAGSSLLRKAEQIALERGKESVDLIPLSTAVAFYEKLGFTHAGYGMKKTIAKIAEHITPEIKGLAVA